MPETLQGARVTMTTASVDDATDLIPAYNGDPDFNLLNGGTAELTLEAVRADLIEAHALPGGTVWRIADAGGEVLGVATTALIPPPHSAWIALLIIRQPFQRQGYGTEVAELLEQRFFARPAIVHIGLAVQEENTRALAFWEKRGYRRGLHRRDQLGRNIIGLRRDRQRDNEAQLERVRQQFGATAAGYAVSQGHAKGDELARVAELAGGVPIGDRRALDIATGAGHTAFALAPFVAEVIASDATPQMLLQTQAGAISRGLANVETALADAHDLPFPDASFDIVTCRIAPHHFSALPLAVREMARVTKPGGMVLVVDSVVPEDPDLDAFLNHVEVLRDPSHVRSRTETEWRQLFEDNHLTLIAAERYPHTHDYADWVARAMVPAEEQPALEAAFLAASDAAVEQYQIQRADNHIISYTDEKLLIAGRKI